MPCDVVVCQAEVSVPQASLHFMRCLVLSWLLCCPDVIGIEKTNEFFRLLYDVRGRFIVHRVSPDEGKVFTPALVRHSTTIAASLS